MASHAIFRIGTLSQQTWVMENREQPVSSMHESGNPSDGDTEGYVRTECLERQAIFQTLAVLINGDYPR